QLVRPRRRPARGEDRIRHIVELNEDFAVALRHALTGSKIEGHALPTPIINVRLQRDKGLGLAVVTELVGVAGHRLTVDRSAYILSGYRRSLDVRSGNRTKRAKHLHLLVPDGGRVEVARRLHGDQGKQLKHMVLNHVTQCARALIEFGAALQPDSLGDRDLDVIYVRRIPQRFEQQVRESQREQVLNRLLAEIMVDAKGAVL